MSAPATTSSGLSPEARRALVLASLAQMALLALAAWRNAEQLNTDAIAYLQLAHHYATGRPELAVSGYWSPLLPWLLTPLLKLGVEPLAAARAVMAFSAVVFYWGSVAVLRAFWLPKKQLVRGAWLCAIAGVAWSVRHITPDLLAAGLLGFAFAAVLGGRWLEDERAAVLTGGWWAMAYLAKAVALPLALLVGLPLALLVGLERGSMRRAAGKFGIVLLGTLVVAMPWMVTISFKYERAVFSTTARIAHAVAGPAGAASYHSFERVFHTPDSGRVTQWEDPSLMPYEFWSPFDSAAHFRHQLGVMGGNFATELAMLGGADLTAVPQVFARPGAGAVARVLSGTDLFWLGLLALGVCCWVTKPWRETLARERWRWAAVPCLGVMAVYLPVLLMRGDQRYFVGLLPFLWVAAHGAATWCLQRRGMTDTRHAARALGFTWGSFLVVAVVWAVAAVGPGLPNAASTASRELAGRLRAANVRAPIAGSALMQGGRAGLYTAWRLGVPWHGDEPDATPQRYLASGAGLVVVTRGSALEAALAAHPAFDNLDRRLFKSPQDAARAPLRAFAVKAGASPRQ
jgi:hypothetical protein